MKKNIITISLEFGSGGHSITQAVAEKLNICCYDKMLVKQVAKQSGFDLMPYIPKLMIANDKLHLSAFKNIQRTCSLNIENSLSLCYYKAEQVLLIWRQAKWQGNLYFQAVKRMKLLRQH